MGLNPDEIKSIEKLATNLKKWADNLSYSHSQTVIHLRPSFGQNQVILLLLKKMPAVGKKVEKELNELYNMIGELNGWCTKSTATDDEFCEFQTIVDQLKGSAYELADTVREIAKQASQELIAEKPAETEQTNAKSTFHAALVSSLGILAFILCVHRIPITWLKDHPHGLGLQGSIIFLIPCLVVGYFKPQYRKWCWGAAALSFLVLIISLL